MRSWSSRWHGSSCPVSSSSTSCTPMPRPQLLHAAQKADLLVVARRGSGGFRGLGFGSTADQVARHSPCPVVVVPVDGREG